MNPSTRLDFDKQNRAWNSNKRKRGKALQGSILWQHLKVAPGYLTPVRHGLSRPSARSERQRSGLSAVTLTPRGRRLRRRHRGQVGSAKLNCTSGKVRRRISCLHRGSDGKAASEVFSILPGVQPGLPHEERYLPFPQQLASERCICKFKWVEVPRPCTLDTVSWEFPQLGTVLLARPVRCPLPAQAAPAQRPEHLVMAAAGLGALLSRQQSWALGYSQGLRALG